MKYNKFAAFALALTIFSGSVPAFAAVSPAITASAEETRPADSVLELKVGQSTTATLKGYAETPTWHSENEAVASVDQNGKITAISEGTACVYAVFTDKMLKFQVNVSPADSQGTDEEKTVSLGSITLDNDHASAKIDLSKLGESVECTSSDSSVATVDSQGNITAVGSGKCTISVVSGKTTYVAEITSKLNPEEPSYVAVELGSFSLDTLNQSGQIKLTNNVQAVWSSTDESVATVDQTGMVTAHKIGKCDIIAISGNIKYISHLTSTYDAEEAEKGTVIGSVTLDNTTPSKKLTVNIPDGAKVNWISTDESVATVDQTGIVTAVSSGECQVIVTIDNRKYIVNITSTYAAPSIELMMYEIKGIGNSIQLSFKDGENDAVWSSDNEAVAVVDQSGKVTAKSEGEAVITVKYGKNMSQVKIIVSDIKIAYGDANCDDDVSLADAILILQSIASADKFGLEGSEANHITPQGLKNADCSGNGDGVTPKDALAVQKCILKLITLPEN